eukprot:5276546-Lingulodinium_polyedra.AAC.1
MPKRYPRCTQWSRPRFFASARTSSHSRGFSSSHTYFARSLAHSLSRASLAFSSRSSSAFPTGRATQA